MTGIQTPEVINSLNRLNPTDMSLDNPSLDPGTITPVYSLDPAWINMEPIQWTYPATSISGSSLTFEDTSGAPLVGQAGKREKVRYYPNILCKANGGGTNPITLYVYRMNYTSVIPNQYWLEKTIVNPGHVNIGPFLLLQGEQLRIQYSAGSGSDTALTQALGYTCDPGVPIPLVSHATATAGP